MIWWIFYLKVDAITYHHIVQFLPNIYWNYFICSSFEKKKEKRIKKNEKAFCIHFMHDVISNLNSWRGLNYTHNTCHTIWHDHCIIIKIHLLLYCTFIWYSNYWEHRAMKKSMQLLLTFLNWLNYSFSSKMLLYFLTIFTFHQRTKCAGVMCTTKLNTRKKEEEEKCVENMFVER